jgi:hypothetical protein
VHLPYFCCILCPWSEMYDISCLMADICQLKCVELWILHSSVKFWVSGGKYISMVRVQLYTLLLRSTGLLQSKWQVGYTLAQPGCNYTPCCLEVLGCHDIACMEDITDILHTTCLCKVSFCLKISVCRWEPFWCTHVWVCQVGTLVYDHQAAYILFWNYLHDYRN